MACAFPSTLFKQTFHTSASALWNSRCYLRSDRDTWPLSCTLFCCAWQTFSQSRPSSKLDESFLLPLPWNDCFSIFKIMKKKCISMLWMDHSAVRQVLVEFGWLFIETVYNCASCDFQDAKCTFHGSLLSRENALNMKRKYLPNILCPLFSQVYI